MGLWAKVRRVVQTAVSDLFSEDADTATSAALRAGVPDRTTALVQETQKRLDELKNELALAMAREKQAENVWRTAQAQGQPGAAELEAQHHAFLQAVAALQSEIALLQARLYSIASQSAHLAAREENVAVMERLQKLQRELDKTAVSLHHDLADRKEQIARREDVVTAREEMRAARKKADLSDHQLPD